MTDIRESEERIGFYQPRNAGTPRDPGANAGVFSVTSIPDRFVGQTPVSPGLRPDFADLDPAFGDYLATGLFGGMFSFGEHDENGESGTILYWQQQDGTVPWRVIEEPGTPGGFKYRYYVTDSYPSILAAKLLSAAVPVTDIFRLGASIYYSLDKAGVSIGMNIYWYDADEQLVGYCEGPGQALPVTNGERAFLAMPACANSANALYAAVEIGIYHAPSSAGAILDLHGVLLKPLYPPEIALDPDGYLLLRRLGGASSGGGWFPSGDWTPAGDSYDDDTGRWTLADVTDTGDDTVPVPERVVRHLQPDHMGVYVWGDRLWRVSGTTGIARPIGYSGVKVWRTTDVSVPQSTWSVLRFPDGQNEYARMVDPYHDDVAASARFTAPFSSVFSVTANVQFATNSDGDRGVRVKSYKAGGLETVEAIDTRRARVSGATHICLGGVEVDLSQGEWVEVEVYNSAAGDRYLVGGKNLWVSMHHVG